MIERARHHWKGVSGKTYAYYIYDVNQGFDDNQDGNFIYAKIEGGKRWEPISIGQGDLGLWVGGSEHQGDDFLKKGATHVHVHLRACDQARLEEERDLLARFGQSAACRQNVIAKS